MKIKIGDSDSNGFVGAIIQLVLLIVLMQIFSIILKLFVQIEFTSYVLPISQTLSYLIFIVILFPYKEKNFSTYFNQKIPLIIYPLLVILATALIIVLFPLLLMLPVLVNHNISAIKGMDVISLIVYGLIAIPLFEEMIFRGIILNGFLKHYTPTKAIIYGSIIFTVIHINPAQMISAFIFGLLAGWLYYKTKNILPCMMAHSVFNGLGWVVFKYLSPNSIFFINNKIYFWLFYFFCLIILFISSVFLYKKINSNKYQVA